MKKLAITCFNRRLHGGDMYNTPSRFIREIPAELIQRCALTGLSPARSVHSLMPLYPSRRLPASIWVGVCCIGFW